MLICNFLLDVIDFQRADHWKDYLDVLKNFFSHNIFLLIVMIIPKAYTIIFKWNTLVILIFQKVKFKNFWRNKVLLHHWPEKPTLKYHGKKLLKLPLAVIKWKKWIQVKIQKPEKLCNMDKGMWVISCFERTPKQIVKKGLKSSIWAWIKSHAERWNWCKKIN